MVFIYWCIDCILDRDIFNLVYYTPSLMRSSTCVILVGMLLRCNITDLGPLDRFAYFVEIRLFCGNSKCSDLKNIYLNIKYTK